MTRRDIVRALDSYASLLVLLLANFFVIELVTDARWGAVASILLAAAALIVAISDPDAGKGLATWHWILIAVCVALAPIVLLVTSSSVLGVAYLVPVGLLASATLPVTLTRIAHHKRVTAETILGATCAYILFGLLFAFVYLLIRTNLSKFTPQQATAAIVVSYYWHFVDVVWIGLFAVIYFIR